MEHILNLEAFLEKVLSLGFAVAFAFGLLALLLRKTRIAFGKYLVGFSYAIGGVVWLNCAIAVYTFWHLIGLLIGIFLFGIGVVPLAFLALLFHGEWKLLGNLVIALAIIWGIRLFGAFVADREELRRAQEAAYVLSES